MDTGRTPEIPYDLLRWLERNYKPRCLGEQEAVEDHLRYAGKVDLVEQLRSMYENAQHLEVTLDGDDE